MALKWLRCNASQQSFSTPLIVALNCASCIKPYPINKSVSIVLLQSFLSGQQTDKPICCHNNATPITLSRRIPSICSLLLPFHPRLPDLLPVHCDPLPRDEPPWSRPRDEPCCRLHHGAQSQSVSTHHAN